MMLFNLDLTIANLYNLCFHILYNSIQVIQYTEVIQYTVMQFNIMHQVPCERFYSGANGSLIISQRITRRTQQSSKHLAEGRKEMAIFCKTKSDISP